MNVNSVLCHDKLTMAQQTGNNRIKITHLVNPHFFYFKWVKDDKFDEDLSKLEKLVKDAAMKIEGKEKLLISEVVAVFVPDWHKYIRAAIKKKHDDECYCVWAIDYGVPMLSHISNIAKLPRKFTGMQLNNKRIHVGGIENCVPAQTKYDINTGGIIKEKLSNWSPDAVELTKKLVNQAIKLEFEHVENLAEHKRPHFFGRLMMQRQDGEMVNVLKCLLEMSMAKLVDGSFKDELSTIESLNQIYYVSMNGETLDMKSIVVPVICVKNDTGFTEAEIYGDDDQVSDEETLQNDLPIEELNEELNEFFDESASMMRPNMQLQTDDDTEILSTIMENVLSPQTGAKSTGDTKPKNEISCQKSSDKNTRNDELQRANQRRRNGRDRDRDRNRRPNNNKRNGLQDGRPPAMDCSQKNNQRDNGQNHFASNSGLVNGKNSVNRRLNNQNGMPHQNFGLTEFETFCGRKKIDNIPIGRHPTQHANQFGPQPTFHSRPPFIMSPSAPPPPPQFHGMFGNRPPPHANANRQFVERRYDNYMPMNNPRYPNMNSNSMNAPNMHPMQDNNVQRNAPNMHPMQDNNVQRNARPKPNVKFQSEQRQRFDKDNGTKENIPADVRTDKIKKEDQKNNASSSTDQTNTLRPIQQENQSDPSPSSETISVKTEPNQSE